MAKIEGNLRGVLNCVESLVKNIRRRRDLILKSVEKKECISTKQLSLLLNTFVDQILDDKNQTTEEYLSQYLAEDEPHKDLINSSIEEFKQKITTLELNLKKETEDKKRIQKHCSKIMEKCNTIDGNHKTQIEELKQIIEELKKSEAELKSQLKTLGDKNGNKNGDKQTDPLVAAVKNEIKRELLMRTIKKEEPQLQTEIVQVHCDSLDNDPDDHNEDNVEELSSDEEFKDNDQTLRAKCLTSNLSVSLIRVNNILDKSDDEEVETIEDDNNMETFEEDNEVETIEEEEEEKIIEIEEKREKEPDITEIDMNSDNESLIDLTKNANNSWDQRNKKKRYQNSSTKEPFFKGTFGIYRCSICNYGSRYDDNIISHLERCQPGFNPKFKCDDCSKLFLLEKGLSLHKNTKHNTTHKIKNELREKPSPRQIYNLKTDRTLRAQKRLNYS